MEEVKVRGENLEKIKEAASWMALARLYTNKSFSDVSLFKTLMLAWISAKRVTWHLVEDNKSVI
jgi:hypothetical protein